MASHVLHTNSKWAHLEGHRTATTVNNAIRKTATEQNLIDASISFLEGQEKQLYAWVGESNYEGFINKLREEFAKHGNDVQVFQNMKKQSLNLIIRVNSLFSTLSPGQEIHLRFSQIPTITINGKQVEEWLEQEGFKVEKLSGKLDISFNYEIGQIKRLMNALGGYNFNPESKNSRAVSKHFDDFLKQECFSGKTKIGEFVVGSHSNQVDLSEHLKEKKSPFSYKKENIDEALQGKNSGGLEEIRQAIRETHGILKELCAAGTPILQRSFDRAWNAKIGSNWANADRETLKNFLFLSKGKNASGIAGAIQEMFTAMISEYLNLTIAEKFFSGPVADILGNLPIGESSEQPKSDVEILKTIGIQVKAYNQNSLIDGKGQSQMGDGSFLQLAKKGKTSAMDANVHPIGLDKNLAGHGLYNFGDAIVQCCFNSDNGDLKDLTDTIDEVLLAQAMNLTTNSKEVDFQIGNTVAFYFLDAQYLVPGSVLLKRLQPVSGPTDIQHAVDITGITGYNDAYFELDDGDGEPNFSKYWTALTIPPLGASSWIPTEDNRSEYTDLYTKDVSIHIYFEYQFMYDANYSIYLAK